MLKNCLCLVLIVRNIASMSWLYAKTIGVLVMADAGRLNILLPPHDLNVSAIRQLYVFWYESTFLCFGYNHALTEVVFNLMKDQKRQIFTNSLCEPPCVSNCFLILQKKPKVSHMSSTTDKADNNSSCFTVSCFDLEQPREEKDFAGSNIAQIMQCNTA